MDDKFYLVQVLSKDCEGIHRIKRIGLYRSLKNAIDVANELPIRDYNAYDDDYPYLTVDVDLNSLKWEGYDGYYDVVVEVVSIDLCD